MGQFNFQIPPNFSFDKRIASTVHVVGLDGIPSPGKVTFGEGLLRIERNQNESGHVFIAWPVAGFGEVVLGTGTLPEGNNRYWLDVELARGTLNRLRNQLSLWSEGGLQISAQVHELLSDATAHLGRAILNQGDRHLAAKTSLELALESIFRLAEDFSQQVLPSRLNHVDRGRCFIGLKTHHDAKCQNVCQLSSDLANFAVVVPEEISAHALSPIIADGKYVLGPLLDAGPEGLAAQFREINGFDERRHALIRHVQNELAAISKRPAWVHAVAGLNGVGHRWMNYPQQLQLAVDMLQVLEEASWHLPVMVSFDIPWGERLAWSVGGAHAIQIADSLLRRGIGISMLGLDIHLDYWPTGSLLRDPLQWIDMIDLWSQLGLPLVVNLLAPTGLRDSSSMPNVRGSATDEQIFRLIETVIPMILSRPVVHSVIWNEHFDGDDPRFPLGGFCTQSGQEKPIGQVWRRVKQRCSTNCD